MLSITINLSTLQLLRQLRCLYNHLMVSYLFLMRFIGEMQILIESRHYTMDLQVNMNMTAFTFIIMIKVLMLSMIFKLDYRLNFFL